MAGCWIERTLLVLRLAITHMHVTRSVAAQKLANQLFCGSFPAAISTVDGISEVWHIQYFFPSGFEGAIENHCELGTTLLLSPFLLIVRLQKLWILQSKK